MNIGFWIELPKISIDSTTPLHRVQDTPCTEHLGAVKVFPCSTRILSTYRKLHYSFFFEWLSRNNRSVSRTILLVLLPFRTSSDCKILGCTPIGFSSESRNTARSSRRSYVVFVLVPAYDKQTQKRRAVFSTLRKILDLAVVKYPAGEK